MFLLDVVRSGLTQMRVEPGCCHLLHNWPTFNPEIIIVSWLTKEQRQTWSNSKTLWGNLALDK